MKKLFSFCFILWITAFTFAQTPTYFVHNPSNMGVNNSFMHPSVMKKFVFIYNKAELNAAGISGATTFNQIWFRMNNAGTVNLSNCIITIGHTTLTSNTPSVTFASNFNVGAPVQVVNSNPLSYAFIAGTWNVPTNNWSPIALSTAFTYNDVNNLAVMVEFSAQASSIPSLYADNGGVPITRYTNTVGGANATSTTARPAFGISTSTLPNQPFLLQAKQENDNLKFSCEICEDFQLVKQNLWYSADLGQQWFKMKECAPRQLSGEVNNPISGNLLLRMIGIDKDGKSYASNIESVNITKENSIAVFPNPIRVGQTLNWSSKTPVQIWSAQGQLVATPSNPQSFVVDLPAGVYWIRNAEQSTSFVVLP